MCGLDMEHPGIGTLDLVGVQFLFVAGLRQPVYFGLKSSARFWTLKNASEAPRLESCQLERCWQIFFFDS